MDGDDDGNNRDDKSNNRNDNRRFCDAAYLFARCRRVGRLKLLLSILLFAFITRALTFDKLSVAFIWIFSPFVFVDLGGVSVRHAQPGRHCPEWVMPSVKCDERVNFAIE
jgi:hypothetical protein